MFDNSKPRTAELTIQNQNVCEEFYRNAREGKPYYCIVHGQLSAEDSAVVWQNSAAAHFVKTAHRMNLLQPMLQSCAYWHARTGQ